MGVKNNSKIRRIYTRTLFREKTYADLNKTLEKNKQKKRLFRGGNVIPSKVSQIFSARFKYFLGKSNVQTARESAHLNRDSTCLSEARIQQAAVGTNWS